MHELCDPVFYEEDGQLYLVYSIAGKSRPAPAKTPIPAFRNRHQKNHRPIESEK